MWLVSKCLISQFQVLLAENERENGQVAGIFTDPDAPRLQGGSSANGRVAVACADLKPGPIHRPE